MIKKVTTILRAKSSEEWALVCELLRRVGFAEGKTWERGESSELSKGSAFEAPVAQIEVAGGEYMAGMPELFVEVSELGSVAEVVRSWSGEELSSRVTVGDIEETDWGSEMLRVGVGSREIGFWMWKDPEKNIEPAIEGKLHVAGRRFGIVVSRWNQVITERLLHGAIDALRRAGVRRDEITVLRVPGAFELPSGARMLAESGKVDAIITLGCLIRGETTHYEHIAEEATRGIGQSAQDTGVPHAYGLLTCENLEQALDRAGLKAGNKGFEAALTAVEMVSLREQLAISN